MHPLHHSADERNEGAGHEQLEIPEPVTTRGREATFIAQSRDPRGRSNRISQFVEDIGRALRLVTGIGRTTGALDLSSGMSRRGWFRAVSYTAPNVSPIR